MEKSSIIIGLCILAAVILPFYIASVKRKRKDASLVNEFIATGFKYGIEITETDHWRDRIIGIDTTAKKLLFRNNLADSFIETLVDLNKVSGCSLEITYLKTAGTEKPIDTIHLNFRLKGDPTPVLLSIFNSDADMMIYSEFEIGQKWNTICSNLLK